MAVELQAGTCEPGISAGGLIVKIGLKYRGWSWVVVVWAALVMPGCMQIEYQQDVGMPLDRDVGMPLDRDVGMPLDHGPDSVSSCDLQQGDLLITEIMYNPLKDCPEWIELYNPTATKKNLRGMKITINNTTRPIDVDESIESNAYFVLAINNKTCAENDLPVDHTWSINSYLLDNEGELTVRFSCQNVPVLELAFKEAAPYYPKAEQGQSIQLSDAVREEIRVGSSGVLKAQDRSNWCSSFAPETKGCGCPLSSKQGCYCSPKEENEPCIECKFNKDDLVISEIMAETNLDEFFEFYVNKNTSTNLTGLCLKVWSTNLEKKRVRIF